MAHSHPALDATAWGRKRRRWVAPITFLVYFIENVLLTVVVPVIPDYVEDGVEAGGGVVGGSEFGRIGLFFASKSLVQLVANPILGWATTKVRNDLLIVFGNVIFFVSAIMFAAGESYEVFLAARSIHGVGSACSIIAGLAMLSETYEEDEERSRVMGFSLGGMAVGVLVGYPAGGFLYTYIGKAAPFLLSAAFSLLLAAVLFTALPLSQGPSKVPKSNVHPGEKKTYKELLTNRVVLISIGSIGASTIAIATLEACLPLWLRKVIRPSEWQIGTAFLPDSLGYLLGTNGIGVVGKGWGRWRCALASHAAVALATAVLPRATAMSHLILPHFAVGLGIATIDAALMPLLASEAEGRGEGGGAFGAVFALYQTTVCLAYGLGPFLGGFLMASLGFQTLMWAICGLNILFIPLVCQLRHCSNAVSDDEKPPKELVCPTNGLENYGATAVSAVNPCDSI